MHLLIQDLLNPHCMPDGNRFQGHPIHMASGFPPVSSPSSGRNGWKKGDQGDPREGRPALPVIIEGIHEDSRSSRCLE